MPLPDPVIVIPGITANYLQDQYPLPPDDIWTVLHLDYERSAFHPDDLRYEAIQPSLVRPGQLYEIAYKELIEELRHNLSQDPAKPVPVFPFSYDWRQPLEAVEPQLMAFIEEIAVRTALMPHYAHDGYAERKTVTLLGHSMGGLVIAGFLERYKEKSSVRKVITLATPFKGSFEAVIKVTTGTANLGTKPPSSREREAARVTPSLYYLLPDVPDGIVFGDPALPKTLFDPAIWQPSILQTIERYVKDRSVNPVNPAARARSIFQRLLQNAKAHRKRITAFRLNDAGLEEKDWLCVAGVNSKTRVRLEIVQTPDGADFRFHNNDRLNQWSDPDPGKRVYTGDGTVPFEGALPEFISRDAVICVTPEDYGYWEIQDKLTTDIGGFHGLICNMDMLHRLIVRHLTGAADNHGNTWGRRAPGVAKWAPPLPLTEKF